MLIFGGSPFFEALGIFVMAGALSEQAAAAVLVEPQDNEVVGPDEVADRLHHVIVRQDLDLASSLTD